MPLPRISHKRRSVQSLLIAAVLLLPFATLSGNPFLRMDIAKMTLFLVGIPLRIDQFYLVLLVILVFVVLFILVTVVLGRVWCGWLCPQTVCNDLVELLAGKFRTKVSPAIARLFKHISALIIATLISFNLFCWFLPPKQVAGNLINFPAHLPMFATVLFLTLLGYINIIFVKRSFCRSYCPYGRFQAALMDAGTLNLSFLDETRDKCLRCNACVRTCPMEIDIRSVFQIECINCGRCIDACRSVMERKPNGVGLIDYRFGTAKGTRFKVRSTTIALLLVTVLLIIGLVWGVQSRSQSAFAVQRIGTAAVRHLPDGSVAQSWRAIIGNRSEDPHVYSIRIAGNSPVTFKLLGQTNDIRIAANQHSEVTFMILIGKESNSFGKLVLQLWNGDIPISTVTLSP